MNRKYKHLFKPLDIIIYLNAILFFSAISQLNESNISVMVVMVLFGIFNIVFLVLTMKLRHQFHLRLLDEIVTEAKLEEVVQKDGDNHFIKLKQEMLENRIYGEMRIQFPNAKIIKNAYIPKPDNTSSEIDILVIDVSGIYIIEAKNLAGVVTGNWTSDEKLVINHPGGKSYSILNPIKQNTGHYRSIKNATGLDSRYFRSLVIIGDHTIVEFKTVPGFARVCQLKHVTNQLKYLAKLNPVELAEHEIEQIYETLSKYVAKTDEKLKNHVESIK